MAFTQPHRRDSQKGSAKRSLKLTYRTKPGDLQSVKTMSTSSSDPISPSQSDFCPFPRSPPSIDSNTSNSSTSCASRSVSQSTASLTPRTSNNSSKKQKGFSLGGLFGAKEPSAQALIEYQKQLLKQGNGRVTAVGLPGVSSAKLPPTVPKTNSRWDGVPQTVRVKEKYLKESKRRSNMGLHRTMSSAESLKSDTRMNSSRERESKSRAPTHSRGHSRNDLADIYGWQAQNSSGSSIKERHFAANDSRPSTSHTTSSLPNVPTLQHDSSFPPLDLPRPPKYVRTGIDAPPSSCSGPLSPPDQSFSPTVSPCDLSPVTPDAIPPHKAATSPRSSAYDEKYFKSAVPTFDEKVIVKSAGANILGPPATAKRRPRLFPDYYDGEGGKIQDLDFQLTSIFKKDPANFKKPKTQRKPPSRPQLASGSLLVLTRSMSTGKGSGLAVNLKNQGAPPTLSPRPLAEASSEDERIITPTPESGNRMKKSRMSMFGNP